MPPDSAPAGMPAPTTSSMPSSSRCGAASATAHCRFARSCGSAPVDDDRTAQSSVPGRAPGLFRESALDRGLDADERLRRVDVHERGLALERHFDHGFAVAADEMARAYIAFDRHQVWKEPPRPQHRIAALALDGR